MVKTSISTFLLAPLCSFADGNVVGLHMYLNVTNSEDECAILVKKKNPKATGALLDSRNKRLKLCYAVFGDRIKRSSALRACLFPGTLLSITICSLSRSHFVLFGSL